MKYTIATLGSHSALQILKGGKDEGFRTCVITLRDKVSFYKRFPFIDEIIPLVNYRDFVDLEERLLKNKTIIIPHGSFVAYLGTERNKQMRVPYFGNKAVLEWEEDRMMQREWLYQAGINVPKQFLTIDDDIQYPVIVKTYGAAGGKGYVYARNKKDLREKLATSKLDAYIIQEYILGVTMYIHYFYSPITDTVEIMSMDRRYETNVDSLGRIPLLNQEGLLLEPSYVVVGNSPLILRESLLPEAYLMGERVVAASKKLINKKGLTGPFCIETIITPDQIFYAMEISCRIVAGTNLYIEGSPYSWLHYNEPMSTGRRIARELKNGILANKLGELLD